MPTKPFYLVDQVKMDSPASLAGLKHGDKVLQFGSIRAETVSPASMKQVVMHSIGRGIGVTVYRNGEGMVQLTLVPQRWDGPGLLGCHLLDL